jgi:hypothetical protein
MEPLEWYWSVLIVIALGALFLVYDHRGYRWRKPKK